MPTTTITRAIGTANFHVGDTYNSAVGDDRIDGVISDLSAADDTHGAITLEMADDEHRRMLASQD